MRRIVMVTCLVGLLLSTTAMAPQTPDMASVPPTTAMAALPAVPPTAAMAAPAAAPMAVPVATPVTALPVESTPEWKTPGFWITKVGLPVLLFVFGLLVTLGVIKKSWLQWIRDKGIVTVADKVVSGLESYAAGTPAKWDDVLAQVLRAVVTRFGELAPAEKAKVEAVVAERQDQAAKKNGDK